MSKTIMPSSHDFIAYVGGAQIRFERGLHLPPRNVENHRFLYVESGSGEFIIPDERLQLGDRMLLLLSPGVREIRYDDKRPVSYTYIEFSVTRDLITEPWFRVPETSPHFQTVIGLLRSALHEDGREVESIILAAIDLTLRHTVADASTPAVDRRIRDVLDYIDRNLNRALKVSELAELAGLSEPQFRRVFRANMSTGPKEYLLRTRMHYARRILESEGLRVSDIAEVLQFETVYQFSKQYKKVHGHSPTRRP
ncbi:MAG: AraC family transcriptional regulator [Planctomycetota bacterium]|nr:AraC family transcriptional regulator [Planctomycetota bacterium]